MEAGPKARSLHHSTEDRGLSWSVDRSRNARTFQPSPNTHEHYSASRVPRWRGGLRCTRRGRKREAEADQRASIEMTRWPCVCSGGRAPPGRVIRFESEVAESVGRVRIKPPTTTICPTTRGIKAKPQIKGKKKTYITWFGLSGVVGWAHARRRAHRPILACGGSNGPSSRRASKRASALTKHPSCLLL